MRFGRIVNISSMAAKTGGVTAGTAYAASKGALSSLTFSLARCVCVSRWGSGWVVLGQHLVNITAWLIHSMSYTHTQPRSEAAATGVTVNAIAPAYVKTPMVTEQLTEAQRQAVLAAIPVGRFCEPEEVAHTGGWVVVGRLEEGAFGGKGKLTSSCSIHTHVSPTVRFLISPLAGFITGEVIDQNGGYHMD